MELKESSKDELPELEEVTVRNNAFFEFAKTSIIDPVKKQYSRTVISHELDIVYFMIATSITLATFGIPITYFMFCVLNNAFYKSLHEYIPRVTTLTFLLYVIVEKFTTTELLALGSTSIIFYNLMDFVMRNVNVKNEQVKFIIDKLLAAILYIVRLFRTCNDKIVNKYIVQRLLPDSSKKKT